MEKLERVGRWKNTHKCLAFNSWSKPTGDVPDETGRAPLN